jgi:hypothetical protein
LSLKACFASLILISLALGKAKGGPMKDKKISKEEFILKAIKALRKDPYKGIHSVYSGFNAAYAEYFKEDPKEATKQLASKGSIVLIPRKGGVMLYLPEDAPVSTTGKTLAKILS